MAPSLFLKRQQEQCVDEFNQIVDCNSSWNNWVRWVVLAVIVVLFFFFFVLVSCLSARRRRRQGLMPYRGTGWAAYNYSPPTYQQSQQQPYFTPHNTGFYAQNAPPNYAQNDAGYYGGHTGNTPQATGYGQRDIELQSPEHSYAPPQGPPPGKKGGVVA